MIIKNTMLCHIRHFYMQEMRPRAEENGAFVSQPSQVQGAGVVISDLKMSVLRI